jgi:O-antigen biosynthesis protein WbqV
LARARSKPLVSLAHDVALAGVAFLVAMFLRLGAESLAAWGLADLGIAAAVAMLTAGIAFLLGRTHTQIWRFAAWREFVELARAVAFASLLFLIVMFVIDRAAAVPRSVPIIQALVLVVLLCGARLAYQATRRRGLRLGAFDRLATPSAVLIWGADRDAATYLHSLLSDSRAPFRPVGVIDDTGHFHGRNLHGVPILGTSADLPAVVARLGRQGTSPQFLIASRALDQRQRRRLLEQASGVGLGVVQIPRRVEVPTDGLDDLFSVERLTRRQPITLDDDSVVGLVVGRRVLVTGAGGSIGSELVRQIVGLRAATIVMIDRGEFNLYAIEHEVAAEARANGVALAPRIVDIRDTAALRRVFAAHRPEVVFHAAALKHVPLCELNPIETILNNVHGTRNVANAAAAVGALAMVHVSTDKAVNPTNVMGATKRIAELYCQSLDWAMARTGVAVTRFMIVRFGNVLGSSGSVVPLFRRQVLAGGPVTVTHAEVTRYFMSIKEAVGLVLRASAAGLQAERSDRGRIFVLDMGEPVRILDVARQVIRLAGLEPERDIEIEFTGLRPGEKLYEELFYPDEALVPTPSEGVLAALSRPLPLPQLCRRLDLLIDAARRHDEATARRLVAGLVPSMAPGDPGGDHQPASSAAQDRPALAPRGQPVLAPTGMARLGA